jgi:hypothetical protein
MSETLWENWRFRIGVRWLWIEKNRRELLSRAKRKDGCSVFNNTKKPDVFCCHDILQALSASPDSKVVFPPREQSSDDVTVKLSSSFCHWQKCNVFRCYVFLSIQVFFNRLEIPSIKRHSYRFSCVVTQAWWHLVAFRCYSHRSDCNERLI